MPIPPQVPLDVIVTPRFDVFYALSALSSEGSTPLGGWKEKAEARLPRGFAAAAKNVAPVPIFWPLLADALQGTPGAMTFGSMLSALRSMQLNVLKASILGGIFHDRSTVQALLKRDGNLSQVLADDRHPDRELLTHFGLRPYAANSPAVRALASLLADTAGYRDALTGVLEKFWESGFRADWSRLEPTLEREANRIRSLAEENSIAGLATALRLPVVFEEGAGVMRTRSGTITKVNQIERCYLVPSAFNTRRWWARYEARGERVTLYFPVWLGAEAVISLERAEDRPERATTTSRPQRVNPEAVFRALGDTTRYAIASILARNPTSSAELSRSLKVSKPTITHHVHVLRSAGLITEAADGGSSRLSLNRETVAALSVAAENDLFASTRELRMLTTRHRKGSRKRN